MKNQEINQIVYPNNKIIYPWWIDNKITGVRGESNSSTTYKEVFEFLGFEKQIQQMSKYYSSPSEIWDVFCSSMKVEDYDRNVHHDGVEYDEKRLNSKGKPYVSDLAMIARCNDKHFRKTWNFAHRLFHGASSGTRPSKDSPVHILGTIAYNATSVKEKYTLKKRELTDPIFLQRRDLSWFIEKQSSELFFYDSVIQYAEGVSYHGGRDINHFYSTIVGLLKARGKEINSVEKYGIKGNRRGKYNYLYDFYLGDDHTLWDFIKAVIQGYMRFAGGAKSEILYMQERLASGNYAGSTCESSNFFGTMKARAQVKALKVCYDVFTTYELVEKDERSTCDLVYETHRLNV